MIRLTLFLLIAVFISATPHSAKAYEGTGLLHSDLQGALPKGLWRNQYRSEIIYLLENLPASGPNRAYQEIKRDMLISTYDPRMIENDVTIDKGGDLLTLRLQKLYEMGLWEDAFKLYTQAIEDPGNDNALAQLGVMLIFHQKGLSTACLEEKVLNARFSEDSFWQQMDKICTLELGIKTSEADEFSESSVLQQLFFDQNFKISVNDIEKLNTLSPLEISILIHKNAIDYKDINLSNDLSPFLMKSFLEDDKFPAAAREGLEKMARGQAILPLPPLNEAQLKAMETPETLSQESLLDLISYHLKQDKEIPQNYIERLVSLAENHPENYYFIKILNHLDNSYGNNSLAEENFNLGQQALMEKYPQNVILLQSLLDKTPEFSNNPDIVYEKQIDLTPDDGYVMSTGSPKLPIHEWLERTVKHRFSGLSLLLVLSNIEKNANGNGDINPIISLSNVGLIDQAHHIAKYELALMMTL